MKYIQLFSEQLPPPSGLFLSIILLLSSLLLNTVEHHALSLIIHLLQGFAALLSCVLSILLIRKHLWEKKFHERNR
ncbi:MAG: hypothetical protein KatS3mg031_0190 [Chitinophagales bacterium]|nr:MAG: hypothetical protein KatS3mg031_0190 [Chitinophagales bacterium]